MGQGRTTNDDYVNYSNNGTTDGSIDGNFDDGWAYESQGMNVWIETTVSGIKNDSVHEW